METCINLLNLIDIFFNEELSLNIFFFFTLNKIFNFFNEIFNRFIENMY